MINDFTLNIERRANVIQVEISVTIATLWLKTDPDVESGSHKQVNTTLQQVSIDVNASR